MEILMEILIFFLKFLSFLFIINFIMQILRGLELKSNKREILYIYIINYFYFIMFEKLFLKLFIFRNKKKLWSGKRLDV